MYVGTVKSFDASEGYGFISSVDAKEKYNRDVFLHSRQLPSVGNEILGYIVSFGIELNNRKMPQARNVKCLDPVELFGKAVDNPALWHLICPGSEEVEDLVKVLAAKLVKQESVGIPLGAEGRTSIKKCEASAFKHLTWQITSVKKKNMQLLPERSAKIAPYDDAHDPDRALAFFDHILSKCYFAGLEYVMAWKINTFGRLQAVGGMGLTPSSISFVTTSSAFSFAPTEGLPGRALQGKCEYSENVQDLEESAYFRRNLAQQRGIKTSFGIPISGDSVLEFGTSSEVRALELNDLILELKEACCDLDIEWATLGQFMSFGKLLSDGSTHFLSKQPVRMMSMLGLCCECEENPATVQCLECPGQGTTCRTCCIEIHSITKRWRHTSLIKLATTKARSLPAPRGLNAPVPFKEGDFKHPDWLDALDAPDSD